MVKWPNCPRFFFTNKIDMENALQAPAGPDYPSTRRWSESPSRAATAQGRRRYASCALPLPQPTSAEGWCLSIYLSFCLSTYLSICLFTLLSICLFVALSFCLFVVLFFLSFIDPSTYLFISPSMRGGHSTVHSAFLLYFMHIWFIYVCICPYAICFIDNRGIQGTIPPIQGIAGRTQRVYKLNALFFAICLSRQSIHMRPSNYVSKILVCWSHPYSSHYLGLHPSYRKWGSYHWKIDYPKLDQHELGCTSYEPTNPGYTSECSSFLGLHFAFGGNEFRVPSFPSWCQNFRNSKTTNTSFPWSIFASHQLKNFIFFC